MARRCSSNRCPKPRATWWRQALGVNWLSSTQGYSSEMQAVISKWNSLGYTKPDADETRVLDELLSAWLDAFPETISLHVQGLGSIQAGTINLVSPNTLQHTIQGAVTFQNPDGVKSDGTTSYIRTGRVVNSYAGIEGNLTSGVYISESSTAFSTTKTVTGARILAASNVNTLLSPLTTSSAGSRQRYAAADTFANTDMKGLYIQTYDGTNNILYKDYDNIGGGIKDSQAVSPSAPDIANEIYWLARNGSTTGGHTPGNYFPHFTNIIFAIQKRITDSDAATIKTLIDLFRAGVGLALFAVSGGAWADANLWTDRGTWVD